MPQVSLAPLRVLLTRPTGEAVEDWASAFAAVGAQPVLYPTLAIVPPASWQALDVALAKLASYDWLVFTSQTAVGFVLGRLPAQRFPQGLRAQIAAVGPATARAVEAGGGTVALLPDDRRQEGLVEAFRALPASARVLFPVAATGRTLLADSLRAAGCIVDVVTVYQTRPIADLPSPPAFDVATFASPSALEAYLARAGRASLAGKIVAVIGPTTARVAAANGIPSAVAQRPDVEALILAIDKYRTAQGDA
jgi:uroporphyrinogen-III synthase